MSSRWAGSLRGRCTTYAGSAGRDGAGAHEPRSFCTGPTSTARTNLGGGCVLLLCDPCMFFPVQGSGWDPGRLLGAGAVAGSMAGRVPWLSGADVASACVSETRDRRRFSQRFLPCTFFIIPRGGAAVLLAIHLWLVIKSAASIATAGSPGTWAIPRSTMRLITRNSRASASFSCWATRAIGRIFCALPSRVLPWWSRRHRGSQCSDRAARPHAGGRHRVPMAVPCGLFALLVAESSGAETFVILPVLPGAAQIPVLFLLPSCRIGVKPPIVDSVAVLPWWWPNAMFRSAC